MLIHEKKQLQLRLLLHLKEKHYLTVLESTKETRGIINVETELNHDWNSIRQHSEQDGYCIQLFYSQLLRYKKPCERWGETALFACRQRLYVTMLNIACVASVSSTSLPGFSRVGENPGNEVGVSSRGSSRKLGQEQIWMTGEGGGEEGTACPQTPRFWKTAFAHERSFWLERCG